jgi:hypothetical protein
MPRGPKGEKRPAMAPAHYFTGAGSFVIRRGAATSAVKAIAEFGQDNPETDGNEIDTNVFVECPPFRLRKLDDAGLSTLRAF